MKIGDKVRIVALPEGLPDGMGTRALFVDCLNRVFPIAGIEGNLVELEVGEMRGEAAYMQSIWIEKDFVEAV